ncbi:MAG: PLD nuclease N-terminal domain-containing protein [Clostridiales bacterium]|nr:PLD nuclease N-terminal domain-containing protein [Clostridiales bacterium]
MHYELSKGVDKMEWKNLTEYLPVLIPIAIIQLGLMLAALVHAIRHPQSKTGTMAVWIVVIVLLNIIGPVLYFLIGRGEQAEDDYDERS